MDFFGAQDTISYCNANMLPKAFFDKTAFGNFKISNNFERNIDETDLKQPKIYRKISSSLWTLKILRKKSGNQKSRNFC
jgi:hypothetical protein